MTKILFVEDDPFIAEIYKKKFEAAGFEVHNVTSGKAVLKAVREDKYDMVLLDLVIPELSGKDVLKELRVSKEYDKDLKIVVFSNLSSPEDRDECLKLGADGFISKTEFTPSEAVKEVNRFLMQFREQKKNELRQEQPEKTAKLGKRILLIEDEAVFVEMFGKRLRDEGYDVVAERDGNAGLQRAIEGTFDLVICDIVMPGMDGRDLVMRLKEAEKENNTPIFLFSASLENEDLKALETTHSVEKTFLKTQITPSELTYAVNDFFKEQEKGVVK